MNESKSIDATGLYEEMAGSVEKKVVKKAGKESRLSVDDYRKLASMVNSEIGQVLELVKPEEIEQLMAEIVSAEKIFCIGVGRVFLSLQCLAKRLAHFGFDVNLVGSVVEKAITEKDLLIVASGSGESKLPIIITKIAKDHGARIAHITSAQKSTIKSLADVALHLPSPTKVDLGSGVETIQPMSTLFDQTLHIFGDIICLMLQERTGQTHEELKERHANLE